MHYELSIVPALLVEGFGGSASEGGGGGIEVGNGARIIIGFEEEAFRGAGAEAVCVEVETETEVETVSEELLHLLRFAAKAVPGPRSDGAFVET